MHDGHPHGSCGDCVGFVTPFTRAARYAAWGYCGEQTPPPPAGALDELERAALAGDRAALRTNAIGLFRPEDDDCCDFFRERQV